MASATTAAQLIRPFRPERGVSEEKVSQTEVELSMGKLWLVRGNHRWRAILCLQGAVWITQGRDVQDHVIKAGEMFLISQPGKVIVQALVDARLQITPCLATAPCRAAGFADRVLP